MAADFPLPRRMRTARLARGLSQKALGLAIGLDEFVASPRINQYERGVHAPDFSLVRRLAKALSVPTAYFYADLEQEAELLLLFHSLSSGERKSLIAAAQKAARSARTGA